MSRYVYFQVTDSSGAGVTGDSANLTMRIVKDGVSSAATNTPAEIDSTNLPGWYSLLLTDSELNGNSILITGTSSTSGAIVDAVTILDQQVDATSSVLDVLSTLKTNVDATISSRLAASSYTAPDNSSISAIKTQTDKLTFNASNQV
ncbi:MAG: hypothetical protein D6706_15930, partial [Chloroflexi bacterium]